MTLDTNPSADNPFHRGDRLRKAREVAGYDSIKDFAALVGSDRGTLAKYEKTGDVKKNAIIIAWSWHTGVRPEWIETGIGPMFSDSSPAGPGNRTKDYGGFVTDIRSRIAA